MPASNSRFGSVKSALIGANPIAIDLGVTSIPQPPHAVTDRFVYTVPVGRKLYLVGGWVRLRRATAAAPAGLARLIVQYGPTGFDATLVFCGLSANMNAVNDAEGVPVASGLVMTAGWIWRFRSRDDSTGGTIEEIGSIAGIESDA